VFDPFDLTDIEVRFRGRSVGRAVPRHIGRHAHPHVKPEPSAVSPTASGIDYLRLVERRRAAELARRIDYRGLDPNGNGSTDNSSDNSTDADANEEDVR